MKNNEMVGQSPIRVGGLERVTGSQRYVADLRFDNVLHVKLVHPAKCARTKILSIDASLALQVPGVRHVFTAADFPKPMPRFGPAIADWPLLAVDETRFYGEAVAAVVADTEEAAETAAGLVRVEFEELSAVLSVEDALNPDSPLVADPATRVGDKFANTNVVKEWNLGHGNVEDAESALVIENTYTFPMVTHFAIEPHAYIAAPDQDGVTVWSPMQHPFILQKVLCAVLKLPVSKVRVISIDPGGGFGGKGWPRYESLLAFLALKLGKTMRIVLTLEETFQIVRRTSARVHVRSGFDAEGHITFQDIDAHFLIGGYQDVALRPVSKGAYAACGPYRTPNARVHVQALYSHTTPATAFRGFGTPQGSWAVESQLNEAAARLGLDALEIRRRNVARRDEDFIPGDKPCDGDWLQVLDTAAKSIHWNAPLAKNHGRGIALGVKSSSTAAASFSIARLHYDGSVSIMGGTSDMGQGARTVYSQIAAKELGVNMADVTIVLSDTSLVPFDTSTSASRSMVYMGNAILRACTDLKARLAQLMSECTGVPLESIEVLPGIVRMPDRDLTFPEALRLCFAGTRGEVIGVGSYRTGPIEGHPLGAQPCFWEFNAVAVETAVDPETGTVQVDHLVVVSDVGEALNPRQVEVQDEGSAIMGLGHSLMEHLVHDEHGRIVNLGALDYRIPTIKDIPLEVDSVLIENGDGPGPYGSKGVGEGGLLSIAAAVGAAVNQAVGVSIRDLPLTAERVWRAIQEQSNTDGIEPADRTLVRSAQG
jgi:CO/xanthine dehydrogenase Mo-binding subunit